MRQQDREKEHFDKLAEETGEIWWGSVTPAGLRRLERRASFLKKSTELFQDPYVLELGCGTGAFTKPLLTSISNLRLVGVDVSPKTIEKIRCVCNSYPNARFEVADVSHMQYASDTFDAVVGNSVLHHVPLKETLLETFRVLKPGGLFYFFEPNMLNPQIALEKNIRFIGRRLQNSPDETAFFRWSLAKHLRANGFVDVSIKPFDFLHPAVPNALISAVSSVGGILEKIPVMKEVAGSLIISAKKPRI